MNSTRFYRITHIHKTSCFEYFMNQIQYKETSCWDVKRGDIKFIKNKIWDFHKFMLINQNSCKVVVVTDAGINGTEIKNGGNPVPTDTSVCFNYKTIVIEGTINGFLPILKYGKSLDPPVFPPQRVVDEICSFDKNIIQCLEFLSENNIFPSYHGMDLAAEHGIISVLEFGSNLDNPVLATPFGLDKACERGSLGSIQFYLTRSPLILPTSFGMDLASNKIISIRANTTNSTTMRRFIIEIYEKILAVEVQYHIY